MVDDKLTAENMIFTPHFLDLDVKGDSVFYYIASAKETNQKVGYVLTATKSGYSVNVKTVVGLTADFKIKKIKVIDQTETPGLGAEIKDNKEWKNQFVGKSIYDAAGEYTGIGVIKGGAKEPTWQVDGISGATITADGVGEMLTRGLNYYAPVLDKMKKS
jgi:Na+-transporting NADH:ubiquinone oxidoreductase subunit C